MAIMHAICFNTGRDQAKQHSGVVDWSLLNKNVKDRLFSFSPFLYCQLYCKIDTLGSIKLAGCKC